MRASWTIGFFVVVIQGQGESVLSSMMNLIVSDIFEDGEVEEWISPSAATVALQWADLIGCVIAFFLVAHFGRRTLFIIGNGMCFFFMLMTGLCFLTYKYNVGTIALICYEYCFSIFITVTLSSYMSEVTTDFSLGLTDGFKDVINLFNSSVTLQFVTSTHGAFFLYYACLLYTSPSPRDRQKSRMPSSA